MLALLKKLIKPHTTKNTTTPETPQRPIKIGDAVILHNDVYNTHVAGTLVIISDRVRTIQLPNGRYYRSEGYLTHDPNA